jgi:DNA-binding transcriptional ArsR family regulator
MELDFKTVKALSSPTRIEILNEALRSEATPTEISNSVDRSKSTVSSHLEKLQDAGLLEKESEDGRRRVIYRPTEKTETILNGRSKKVKFSLLSTVSNAWIGLGLGLAGLKKFTEPTSQPSSSSGGVGTMAMDKSAEAGGHTAEAASLSSPENILLVAGLGFLSIAVAGLLYGLLVSRLEK